MWCAGPAVHRGQCRCSGFGHCRRSGPRIRHFLAVCGGSFYLAIGLFVYFRRGSAYKARHFYIFCLASFVFSCFHYTGKLNVFDQVIYWGNLVAGWLAPALFLHFCLTFPEPRVVVPKPVGK